MKTVLFTRALPTALPMPMPSSRAQQGRAALASLPELMAPQPSNSLHSQHPQFSQWLGQQQQQRQQQQQQPTDAAIPFSSCRALERPLLLSLCTVALCLWQAWSPTLASAMDRDIDTFENVPEQLRSDGNTEKRLGSLMQGSKRKEVESCVRKCVPTCIRGGQGAPGLGPITMRQEVVVFKDGFRSRAYCLRECAEVCSLSINGPAVAADGK